MIYRFDEKELKRKLRQLPKRYQIVMAVACAQRILPQYLMFIKTRSNNTQDNIFVKAISELWDDLISNKGELVLDRIISECETNIPDEDEIDMAISPYAEDAAVAVYYALSASVSDTINNVIWSCRRCYEAVDNYIINKYEIDPSTLEGERLVLVHPVMQKELFRQNRDLGLLTELVGDSDSNINKIRTIAINESEDMFD